MFVKLVTHQTMPCTYYYLVVSEGQTHVAMVTVQPQTRLTSL